jgi:hypothetical protein
VRPGFASGGRDRALLLVGFVAALRRSELAALTVDVHAGARDPLGQRQHQAVGDEPDRGTGQRSGLPARDDGAGRTYWRCRIERPNHVVVRRPDRARWDERLGGRSRGRRVVAVQEGGHDPSLTTGPPARSHPPRSPCASAPHVGPVQHAAVESGGLDSGCRGTRLADLQVRGCVNTPPKLCDGLSWGPCRCRSGVLSVPRSLTLLLWECGRTSFVRVSYVA